MFKVILVEMSIFHVEDGDGLIVDRCGRKMKHSG